MRTSLLASAVILVLPWACRSAYAPAASSAAIAQAPARDIHSLSEPDRVRVTHLDLDLALDFEAKVARGTAELAFEREDPVALLVLDTHELAVESVSGSDGSPRNWTFGASQGRLGKPLRIELLPEDERVKVAYATTSRSEALQWLAPEQTAGGAKPFLFSQGQAILTRSWIPLQDSPSVRVTYDARVSAPADLAVVMSAERLGRGEDGAFRFRMAHPIPPYLIAIACGELEFRAVSPRSGVWAEPEVVERARVELADTEAMIASAEKLFGPYRWGRYDLLILPPAFPFGGMENPTLTFATPTILAGDKSLVGLVAHELAHSWSGNLVTNATWSDFWLNEGFTVYFEKRIMEQVYGVERADTELALSRDELEREMTELAPADQVLHIDLAGRHPDDGFSSVPYIKGALFLTRLEELFGRERFDRFLRSWFDGHAFQSVTTDDFVAVLEANLLAADPELASRVNVHQWVEEPGLPADAPDPSTASLSAVDRELELFGAACEPAELETTGWTTQQWLRFLEGLPADLGPERMAALDQTFAFTHSGNSEILCVWLRLSIQHGYHEADARLEEFLGAVGRRKFLKPLYTELMKTPENQPRAKELYARFRPRYHSVATNTLDEIVGVGELEGARSR